MHVYLWDDLQHEWLGKGRSVTMLGCPTPLLNSYKAMLRHQNSFTGLQDTNKSSGGQELPLQAAQDFVPFRSVVFQSV